MSVSASAHTDLQIGGLVFMAMYFVLVTAPLGASDMTLVAPHLPSLRLVIFGVRCQGWGLCSPLKWTPQPSTRWQLVHPLNSKNEVLLQVLSS